MVFDFIAFMRFFFFYFFDMIFIFHKRKVEIYKD